MIKVVSGNLFKGVGPRFEIKGEIALPLSLEQGGREQGRENWDQGSGDAANGALCVDMDGVFGGYMRVYAYSSGNICVFMDVIKEAENRDQRTEIRDQKLAIRNRSACRPTKAGNSVGL
jgi:hypothetical protein